MKRSDQILNKNYPYFKSEAEKKQEEREEIHKKYNIGAYMTPYSLQNVYYQQAINLEPEYYTKRAEAVKYHITYTLKMDYNYYNTQELHQTILKDKKLHGEQESKFLSHVKTYVEKLNVFSSNLSKCENMAEADMSYQQMVSFHDTDLNIIQTEQTLALEDFQVKMAGEYPEGY